MTLFGASKATLVRVSIRLGINIFSYLLVKYLDLSSSAHKAATESDNWNGNYTKAEEVKFFVFCIHFNIFFTSTTVLWVFRQRYIGKKENYNILLPLAVTSCLAFKFEFLVWLQWQLQLHSNCQVCEMSKWMNTNTTSATDPNTMTKCQMKDRKHINWTVIVTGSNALLPIWPSLICMYAGHSIYCVLWR